MYMYSRGQSVTYMPFWWTDAHFRCIPGSSSCLSTIVELVQMNGESVVVSGTCSNMLWTRLDHIESHGSRDEVLVSMIGGS